jgi:hypothetical protein
LDFGDISTNDVLSILKTIPSQGLQTSSAFSFFATTDYTQQWVDGTISNFEYLMLLNIYAGRSFRDPTIYPIFPWIVKDVADNFRDLSLPLAPSSPFAMAPSRPSLLAYFLGRFPPFDTLESVEAFPPFTSMNAAYQLAISGEFSSMELCPEFFFSPDCFTGDFQLPKWISGNAQEFVYAHRKLLESSRVSNELHRWIDLIFGIAAYGRGAIAAHNVYTISGTPRVAGCMPHILFMQPHPRRKPVARFACPASISVDLKLTLFVNVIGVKDSTVTFLAVDSTGRVMTTRIDLLSRAVAHTVVGELPVGNTLFAGCRGGFVAVEKQDSTLFLAKEKSIVKEPLAIQGIDFAASGSKTVVLSDSNGQLLALAIADFPTLRPISCVTCDYISAIAVSSKFGAVALGTRNCRLSVWSLADGSFRFSCEVPEPPTRIVITNCWGFILVESGRTLHLFGINGNLIRTAQLPSPLLHAVTWASDGCDFFAIAVAAQLHIFESFYLRIDDRVFPIPVLVSLHYLPSHHSVMGVGQTTVMLFPHQIATDS